MFSGRLIKDYCCGRLFVNCCCTVVVFTSVATETLESLGDSITSAVLLSWNKKAGDAIAEDDVIAVVETDKVGDDFKPFFSAWDCNIKFSSGAFR